MKLDLMQEIDQRILDIPEAFFLHQVGMRHGDQLMIYELLQLWPSYGPTNH